MTFIIKYIHLTIGVFFAFTALIFHKMDNFGVGSEFPSFLKFKEALKSFEAATNALYVIGDSKKSELISEDFPYQFVTFVCKHGKRYKIKSQGIRPNQT